MGFNEGKNLSACCTDTARGFKMNEGRVSCKNSKNSDLEDYTQLKYVWSTSDGQQFDGETAVAKHVYGQKSKSK